MKSMRAKAGRIALLALAVAAAPAAAQEMALLGVGSSHTAPAGAPAAPDPRIAGLVELARRTRSDAVTWRADRPLTEARNAHKTNTAEQMREALESGASFLEGDVREEINAPHALEMRHDTSHESGNNLTLAQWLEVGRESGRGLKLDVKEPEHMDRVLAAAALSGVPEARLMFNLGHDAMETWGARIRARFPGAWLALNPDGEGPLDDHQVDAFLAQARQFGGRVTFVVRYENLTDSGIRRLEAAAPVSVWNSPNSGRTVEDAGRAAREVRERGVTGVVDIQKSAGLVSKIGQGIGRGWNEVRTFLDR